MSDPSDPLALYPGMVLRALAPVLHDPSALRQVLVAVLLDLVQTQALDKAELRDLPLRVMQEHLFAQWQAPQP